ncbi:MAG: hypothetical protein WCI92_03995 [Bacteroidota bacterium]
MKNHVILFLTVILTLTTGFTTLAQNQKCLAFSCEIIKNIQGKIQNQALDENDVYFIKAEVPPTCVFETVKIICDTSANSAKASFDWRLNYDKNYEKEYIIRGKKVLITYYPNDRFLYFEFPKD